MTEELYIWEVYKNGDGHSIICLKERDQFGDPNQAPAVLMWQRLRRDQSIHKLEDIEAELIAQSAVRLVGAPDQPGYGTTPWFGSSTFFTMDKHQSSIIRMFFG